MAVNKKTKNLAARKSPKKTTTKSGARAGGQEEIGEAGEEICKEGIAETSCHA